MTPTDDPLDRTLTAFFRAELPDMRRPPTPATRPAVAPSAAHRWALAFTAAALVVTGSLLAGRFPPPTVGKVSLDRGDAKVPADMRRPAGR